MAAATNNVDSSGNYVGVAGTCPGCVLYNVKVLADDGPGYSSWAAKGIIWSADNGAKVINMSLGSPSGSSALQDAVNYAWGKGVVVVAAAGNDGTSSPHYPAAYENVIAVGATDSKDQRVVSSTWSSNFGSWVDVVAPGSSILSTMNKVDDPSTKVDESYGYMQGTSMASPHVAGLAGLLASKGYSNSEIRYRIEKTAIDLGTTGKDVEYGYGRIDARDAFACVPDTCPPTVKPPVKSISASSQLVNTSTVPVNLNWFSSDRGGSGIARYELQKSTDFGASWSNVTLLSPTANSPTLYLLGDSYYRFRVRAQDKVGHWSTWAEGPTFKVHKPYQENNPAVSYPSGTWTTSISSAVSGGYFKGSTTCFATAKFSFTGSEVAWVATKSLAYGKVQVRVDGVSYAVVDLSSGTPQARTPVLQKRWSSSGPHTIEVIKTVDYLNPKTGYMACDPSRGVNVDAFTVLG